MICVKPFTFNHTLNVFTIPSMWVFTTRLIFILWVLLNWMTKQYPYMFCVHGLFISHILIFHEHHISPCRVMVKPWLSTVWYDISDLYRSCATRTGDPTTTLVEPIHVPFSKICVLWYSNLLKFYITPTISSRDTFLLKEYFNSSNKTTFVLESVVELVFLSFFRIPPQIHINPSWNYVYLINRTIPNYHKVKLGTFTSISNMVSLWFLLLELLWVKNNSN